MSKLNVIGPPADAYPPHALHAVDRPWPETNCYLDLWIELLHALGRDPLPLLGLAAALDWEADHFTFLKPSSSDIVTMTGVTLHELALWDDTEAHIVAQITTRAVPLLEVDAFFLPDTHSNAYRHKHTKTTIAIDSIDPNQNRLEYFHNAGHFSLSDEDYAGVLGRAPHQSVLFPFAELARVTADPATPKAARELARLLLPRYARTRSPGNPVARFAAALPDLLTRVGPDPARINALCFNTTRQFGGAFGLLADHLAWLGEDSADASWLADSAKTLQFQVARAARRTRPDPAIAAALHDMATVWDRCMTSIAAY